VATTSSRRINFFIIVYLSAKARRKHFAANTPHIPNNANTYFLLNVILVVLNGVEKKLKNNYDFTNIFSNLAFSCLLGYRLGLS
jgi:hypothetical protein